MKLVLIIALLGLSLKARALRCQTDDGITDEEVAKTLRVCVRKQLNEGNEYEEYEDYIWENVDSKTNQNSRPTRLNKRNVYRNIYNEYLVEKRNTYRASYKDFPNESKGNNKTSDGRNNNSTQRCLMQCFFEELKMVDTDGFPEKHKSLHILTKDLRDKDIRDFYINSIQECFHIANMKKRSDKCQFAQDIIVCLTDRAKSNCDDWNDQY